MGDSEDLREIRTLLGEILDLERESLALQRRQEERVERSIKTQEEAVARQRTALRVASVLTVVILVLIGPLLYWLWTQL